MIFLSPIFEIAQMILVSTLKTVAVNLVETPH